MRNVDHEQDGNETLRMLNKEASRGLCALKRAEGCGR